jgi:hypothetical protein
MQGEHQKVRQRVLNKLWIQTKHNCKLCNNATKRYNYQTLGTALILKKKIVLGMTANELLKCKWHQLAIVRKKKPNRFM